MINIRTSFTYLVSVSLLSKEFYCVLSGSITKENLPSPAFFRVQNRSITHIAHVELSNDDYIQVFANNLLEISC